MLDRKYRILFSDQDKILNKNNDFISKCRHRNKFKLCNLKGAKPVDILAHTITDNKTQKEIELEVQMNAIRGRKPKLRIGRLNHLNCDLVNLSPKVILERIELIKILIVVSSQWAKKKQ